MRFFYDFLFLLFFVLSAPKAISRSLKNKAYKGMVRRRFFCPSYQKNDVTHPTLWLNSVSVGETISLGPLVKEIEKEWPSIRLIISCTTGTGYHRARQLYGKNHLIIGYPFDFSFTTKSFLKKLKPDILISIESDFWPNLLTSCKKLNVPFAVVSGRLSESSANGYEKFKFILEEPFQAIKLFSGQDTVDCDRAKKIGIPEKSIKLGGNLKFDLLKVNQNREKHPIVQKLSDSQKKYFIIGSTHNPEEDLIFKQLNQIQFKNDFQYWNIILVPRHPERKHEVAKVVGNYGFQYQFFSEIDLNKEIDQNKIIIVDVIGVLSQLYEVSELCFIGGSLIPHGGQNMIEPAALGKTVIFGPHVFNFREASDLLLKNKAAIQVQSDQECAEILKTYLEEKSSRLKVSKNAKTLIESKQGVAEKTLIFIKPFLKGQR